MKEYRQFCDVEEQKTLKHCSTHWLSVSGCLTTCLKQYDALRSYFVSRVHGKAQKKARDEKGKAGSKPKGALYDHYSEPVNKVYMMLPQATLPVFDSFIAKLETDVPMQHKLTAAIAKFARELARRIVPMAVITSERANLYLKYLLKIKMFGIPIDHCG